MYEAQVGDDVFDEDPTVKGSEKNSILDFKSKSSLNRVCNYVIKKKYKYYLIKQHR